MQFQYHTVESFPRLGWCAVMEQGKETVNLYHGVWVETLPTFFVDGLWEGEFGEGDFDQSIILMGFGARLRGDKVVFCTPCHIQERLFMIHVGPKLYISPSLACVLTVSGSKLDINHLCYASDLIDILREKKYHVGTLPGAEGRRIDVYHFRNIEVDKELNTTVVDKPPSSDFSDFQSYKRFLIDCLQGINRNANDVGRKVYFSPLVALSSGYDSTACAALATEIQCKEAVSLRSARPEGQQVIADSGRLIGEKLGFHVTEYDRLEVMTKEGTPEAEFVACGEFGQDFNFSIFEEKLPRTFLMTGWYGDTVWDRLCRYPIRDIVHPFVGGTSMTEFRCRVGFHLVIVPYFAIMSLPSIYAISNSEEMKPWVMNTVYDRPIARRFAEEKGVDRNLFAQCKKATSILLNRHKKVLKHMVPESARSFELYYLRHKHRRNRFKVAWYHVMYTISIIYNYLGLKVDGLGRRFNRTFRLPDFIPQRYRQSPGRPSFLVYWGIEQIQDRYRLPERQE